MSRWVGGRVGGRWVESGLPARQIVIRTESTSGIKAFKSVKSATRPGIPKARCKRAAPAQAARARTQRALAPRPLLKRLQQRLEPVEQGGLGGGRQAQQPAQEGAGGRRVPGRSSRSGARVQPRRRAARSSEASHNLLSLMRCGHTPNKHSSTYNVQPPCGHTPNQRSSSYNHQPRLFRKRGTSAISFSSMRPTPGGAPSGAARYAARCSAARGQAGGCCGRAFVDRAGTRGGLGTPASRAAPRRRAHAAVVQAGDARLPPPPPLAQRTRQRAGGAEDPHIQQRRARLAQEARQRHRRRLAARPCGHRSEAAAVSDRSAERRQAPTPARAHGSGTGWPPATPPHACPHLGGTRAAARRAPARRPARRGRAPAARAGPSGSRN